MTSTLTLHSSLHFLGFLLPPDFVLWLGVPPVEGVIASKFALPCVAPPPPPGPFLLLARLNVDRSLFFNHRSGSGGGVTPGTTPAGTRDVRVFFCASFTGSCETDAEASVASSWVLGCAGGGLDSMSFVKEEGSVSKACRKPVSMKSSCFWEAWRLVRISECSSDPYKAANTSDRDSEMDVILTRSAVSSS